MATVQLQSSREFVTRLFDALGARAASEQHVGAQTQGSNPLEGVATDVKNQLLALHVAFPNELLPAFDLLDRKLVTRFRIRRNIKDGMESVPLPAARRADRDDDIDMAAVNNQTDEADESLRRNSLPSTGAGISEPSDVDRQDNRIAEPNSAVQALLEASNVEAMDVVYYVRSAQQRSSRFSTSYDTLTSYEVRLAAWNCSCPAFAFSAFPPMHNDPAVSPLNAHAPSEGQKAQYEWNFGGASLGEGMPPTCKHLLACVLAERCVGLFGGCVEEKVVSVEEAAGWAAGWGD